MKPDFIRQGTEPVCSVQSVKIQGESARYLTFPGIEQTGIVKHFFSTREGGVSKGHLASLNFSYAQGDERACVEENFARAAVILGCQPQDIVCSMQTHTTNVRRVTALDKGKGVTQKLDYQDVDGLITNERGIALATFYADCVPLYIVDPVHKAIGLSHSGWRGTVEKMGAVTLQAMQEAFGTNPADVRVAIGPSICQSCYEVSEEVAQAFYNAFEPNAEAAGQYLARYYPKGQEPAVENCLLYATTPGKYQLNLWYANYRVFRDAGVPDSQIEVTDICTCHNPELLFSHRASHGKRGNLGAFLMLC